MSGPTSLKRWRKREGINKSEAAKRLNEEWWNYRRYESGERPPPLTFVIAAQKVCGIPVEAWVKSPRARATGTEG